VAGFRVSLKNDEFHPQFRGFVAGIGAIQKRLGRIQPYSEDPLAVFGTSLIIGLQTSEESCRESQFYWIAVAPGT